MFIERWRGIRARIIAVTEAGKALVVTASAKITNADEAFTQFLTPSLNRIANEILSLKEAPPASATAASVLEDFKHNPDGLSAGTPSEKFNFKLAKLIDFMIKMDAALDDGSIRLAGLVERSILHLNALIVADDTVRSAWQRAFEKGEVACERLGHAHFMVHGLFGVKAASAGAATDQTIASQSLREVRAAFDGIVLTEWKKVTDRSNLEPKQEEGLAQAKEYCDGPLSLFVLSRQRYVILVSEGWMPERDSAKIGDCTYHFRNIVVKPKSVSGTAEEVATATLRQRREQAG